MLRTVAGILSGVGTASDALGQVLGADSVVLLARDAGSGGGEPGTVRLGSRGHRATITMRTGEQVVALREWAPFTDGELARVPALLVLLGFAELRTAAGPLPAPPPAEPTTPRPPSRRRPCRPERAAN